LSLTVFEGGHEMVVPQALALVPVYHATNTTKRNILTIGDSNAASETGWPAQLKKLLPFSTVINKSISGNTIGFDNLGNERLNTIKNIDRYLEEAYQEMEPKGNFDFIFVCLGTNDTKRIFKNRQKEVPSNLEVLIQKIKQWLMVHQKIAAQIVVVSPPPMDEQKADAGKYGGGDKLIQKNNLRFRKTAGDSQADFVDVYSSLKTDFSEKSTDGIHLTEKAQFQLALELVNYLHLKRDQSN
jgi:lysophospholipase L1-like esterase